MCDAEVSCRPRGSRAPDQLVLQQLHWPQCLALPSFAHCGGIEEGRPDLASALTSLGTK